jgi:RNA polymerase sigma factor (sigma-70 family)
VTARSTIPDPAFPVASPPDSGSRDRPAPETLDAPPAWLESAYADHHAGVYRAAYRISGSSADAEDVLQTVFMRLLNRARRSSEAPLTASPVPADELAPYLNRAAVNASLDLLRERQRRGWAPLDPVSIDPPDPSPAADPARHETSRQVRLGLRQALGRLSPRAAEIFALRYFQGFGNQEIAEQVGSSVTAVAVVLHRTRHRLRRELSAWMGA